MAVKERVPHFRPPKRARPGESGRGTDGGTWLRSRRVEGTCALGSDGGARNSAEVQRHFMRPTCVSRRRSKVVSRCFGIVLGKTPGTILFMLPQAEAVPCTHSWEPTTAVLLPLSLRTSARTGAAIRFPFCRGTFFPRRKKVPKERRQNQGFGILPHTGMP